jgi:hypothetical protein
MEFAIYYIALKYVLFYLSLFINEGSVKFFRLCDLVFNNYKESLLVKTLLYVLPKVICFL